jgi:hypothetical protein
MARATFNPTNRDKDNCRHNSIISNILNINSSTDMMMNMPSLTGSRSNNHSNLTLNNHRHRHHLSLRAVV